MILSKTKYSELSMISGAGTSGVPRVIGIVVEVVWVSFELDVTVIVTSTWVPGSTL